MKPNNGWYGRTIYNSVLEQDTSHIQLSTGQLLMLGMSAQENMSRSPQEASHQWKINKFSTLFSNCQAKCREFSLPMCLVILSEPSTVTLK